MAAFLYAAIRRERRRRGDAHPRVPLALDMPRIRRLVALGFPAGAQIILEVGVFAVATALAGKLDPVSAGSHQIALNLAGLAFMVPLGLSSSGAVRVGHAFGAGDPARAARAGWTALAASSVIMLAIALVFFLLPGPLLRAFTSEARVIDIGIALLAIAAAFQLFDGAQAVATGILRGIGDTRTAMVINVIGHWVFGLPAGYTLCFVAGWGVAGLWIGLSIGLVFVATILTAVWWKKAVAMQNAELERRN
jgi:MATE family multidrug resistance protein